MYEEATVMKCDTRAFCLAPVITGSDSLWVVVKDIVYTVKHTSLHILKDYITTATRTILTVVCRAALISTGLRKFVSPIMANIIYSMVNIVFCPTLHYVQWPSLHSLHCNHYVRFNLSGNFYAYPPCFVIVVGKWSMVYVHVFTYCITVVWLIDAQW
jgi:hypothetical protein